jgi:hypothetical protein
MATPYRYPLAVCSRCGRERRCAHARTDAPLCTTCRKAGWQPPVAICAACGRERPCHHASSERPLCQSCHVLEHAPRVACAHCGRVRRVAASSAAGPECSRCRTRRLRSKIVCAGCGARSRPAAVDGARCETCAGELMAPGCGRCGALELNYADRLCARCVLADRIAGMRRDADPEALARLDGFLVALAAAERPWSTLNWLVHGAGAPVLSELLQGRRELSHNALDQVGSAGVYLRAAFVEHGALEARTEADRITAAIDRELQRLQSGQDRTHLRTYAHWRVVHDLARRERRGETTVSSQKYARSRVHIAVDLVSWLHDRDLELQDLRQEHLDIWISSGSTARVRVRSFLAWAQRGRIIPLLDASTGYTLAAASPSDTEHRLAVLQRLGNDESLDRRDRVAGALVVLLAQSITRLVRLTPADVHTHRGVVYVQLGRDAVELPEPFGRLAAELAVTPQGLATTAAAGRALWLFPGLRLDAPLCAEHMRRRLARLGITARPDRTGALAELCQRVPPAILADLLGISEHNAARWAKLSGGEWARYAAGRGVNRRR